MQRQLVTGGIILLLCTQIVLCWQPKTPTPSPNQAVSNDSIPDKEITIDPSQILYLSFSQQLYNIQSIKVQKVMSDGSLQDRLITDYQLFQDEQKYNLGGCQFYQPQGDFEKLMTIIIQMDQDTDNLQSKFSDVLFYPNTSKFLLLSTDYNFYSFAYVSLSVDTQDLQFTIEKDTNYASMLTTSSTTPGDVEPWVKGAVYNGIGYIFTATNAFLLRKDQIYNVTTDMLEMHKYVPRQSIYGVITYQNQLWTASGSNGIDCYQVQSDNSLTLATTYDKTTTTTISNIATALPPNAFFDIVKIKIIQQGSDTILIAQENSLGLHLLLIGSGTKDTNTPSNTVYSMSYLYFIPIQHIASFDASRFTMAITLSSKTFQSGLEIFFDKKNYYINYFEDDELAVDNVILDPNTSNGLWISDDISKVYRYGIYRTHLQYNKSVYENYIDLVGNNYIQFFQDGSDNLVLTVGQRQMEIFNVTNVVPQIVCSSSQGGMNDNYKITFITQYCTDSLTKAGTETDATYLFNQCQVTMNLNFQTNNIAITSANIGLIVGLTIGLLAVLIIALFCIYKYYKKNKADITQLQLQKEKYVSIDSDEHNKMKNPQNNNNNNNNHLAINFAIQ